MNEDFRKAYAEVYERMAQQNRETGQALQPAFNEMGKILTAAGITGVQKATIILPGRPITKKNHSMIVGAKKGSPRTIQSKPYREYEEACLWHLKGYRGPHFAGKVNLKALYWMPSRASWPDLMGLIQATADILERAEILDNDRQVVGLDGSRIMGVDKENPRVEIEIEEVAENGVA